MEAPTIMLTDTSKRPTVTDLGTTQVGCAQIVNMEWPGRIPALWNAHRPIESGCRRCRGSNRTRGQGRRE